MTRSKRFLIFLAVGFVTLIYGRKDFKLDWFSFWKPYAAELYERSGNNEMLMRILDTLVHVLPFLVLALILGYGYVFIIKHNLLRHKVLVDNPKEADYPRAERDPRRLATPTQREQVFERDGYRCVFCGRPVYPGNSPDGPRPLAALKVLMDYQPGHVGHVVAWDLGGETDLPNLATNCEFCNLSGGKRLSGKYLDFVLRVLAERRKTLWRGAI